MAKWKRRERERVRERLKYTTRSIFWSEALWHSLALGNLIGWHTHTHKHKMQVPEIDKCARDYSALAFSRRIIPHSNALEIEFSPDKKNGENIFRRT